ncbi:polysaccharide lyase 8 family protein [Streptomyces sp. NPDC003730]
MTAAMSRRGLLAGTAVAGTAALLGAPGAVPAHAAPDSATGPAPAPAAPTPPPDFDVLLLRAERLLTGGDFDPSSPVFAESVAVLDTEARAHFDALDRSAARTSLWSDLAPLTDPGNFGQSYTRLRTVATAWATPGTSLTADGEVADALVDALRLVHDTAYHPGRAETGNWWFWEIGAPRALLDTVVLLRGRLPAADVEDYLAVVDRFCPDADRRTNSPSLAETGANRADKAVIVALRGLLGADAAKVASARDALSDVRDSGRNSLFRYVTSGDGFHADGSFVQHGAVAYTGTYGVVLLGGIARMLALLAGSPWEITDPGTSVVYDAVERSFAPLVFDGLMMDAVRGRAVSRERAGDHHDGAAAIAAVLLLAASAPPAPAARWRYLAKGWLTRNTTTPFTGLATPAQAALAADVLADDTVDSAERTTGLHVFPDMDRVTHRRPRWAFTLSLSSRRVAAYEGGNGENLHGWYTGDGMSYLYDADDLGQFNDHFWPTVDPYRLPGTTVDTRPRTDLGTGGGTTLYRPANAVAGGAVLDGRHGTVAMDLTGAPGSTLRAYKAWFLLDDAVVALGTGVTATDGRTIETVVENRNLGATGTHRLLVDGRAQPGRQGWSGGFTGARWAHLQGVGGYLFLEPPRLRALREERTGTWRAINTGADTAGSTTPVTRRYLTLWVDHGTSPHDAGHAHVLLPRASAVTTATWALARPVRLLANDTSVQAVEAPLSGLTAAHFWTAGSVAGLACSGPASVVVRRLGAWLRVAVSDPGRSMDRVSLELPYRVRSVVRADDTVTVTPGRPGRLTVDVAGSQGRTHQAELTL